MARYPKQDDPNGENVVPSVTEIISDCTNKGGGLTQWAANCCAEHIKNWVSDPECPYTGQEILDVLDKARFAHKTVSDKALDVGSEVHNAIEMHLQDKPFNLTTKQAENAFQAFCKWELDVALKPFELEKTVWGSRWAGTCDFIGLYDDKLFVIDWKSSKAFYPEMRYQVAAYRDAIQTELSRESTLTFIDGCGILRLDKETGIPHFKDTSKTYEQDLKVFNAMVDLYFERHPLIAKRLRGE